MNDLGKKRVEGLRERMFYWDIDFRAKHPNLPFHISVISLITACIVLLLTLLKQ